MHDTTPLSDLLKAGGQQRLTMTSKAGSHTSLRFSFFPESLRGTKRRFGILNTTDSVTYYLITGTTQLSRSLSILISEMGITIIHILKGRHENQMTAWNRLQNKIQIP